MAEWRMAKIMRKCGCFDHERIEAPCRFELRCIELREEATRDTSTDLSNFQRMR